MRLSGFETKVRMYASGNSKILFITHGAGRGRKVPTGDVFLKRLAAKLVPLTHTEPLWVDSSPLNGWQRN